jgi:hypothetical protein
MDLWQRRRELGIQVSKKRRLYLDVRFWNDLCDAELGVHRNVSSKELLSALTDEVARGDVICPVEFHVVEELHRQKDLEKRAITLRLIDLLSSRTVLVSPTERLFLEVLRLVQGLAAQTPPVSAPLGEVWTRPMFAVGHDLPPFEAPFLPPEVVTQLRSDFESTWWSFGFTEMFEQTGSPPIDPNAKAHTANLLNQAKGDPSTLFESYEATYWAELRGALDAYLPQLEDIWRYLFAQAGHDVGTVTPEQLREAALQLRALLYQGARRVGLRTTVPTLHVGVTLYSRIQWDRSRGYKGNDVFDLAHAEAAIPYFNAFATDASLGSLIRQSKLAAEYPCAILTSAEQILAWLNSRPTA